MATADRMERDSKKKGSGRKPDVRQMRRLTAEEKTARARKARGMARSTARSVGRTISPITSRAARGAAKRKQADAKSGRSTTSPRAAMVERSVANTLTRLPGQDKNSIANRNWRASSTRTVQASRARVAAEKGGTQRAKSAQARAMNRSNRGAVQKARRSLRAK